MRSFASLGGVRGRVAIGACAATVLVLPSPAAAGTAELTTGLSYRAAGGERNRLSLSFERPNTFTLSDPAGVFPGRGCSRPDPADNTRVRCATPPDALLGGPRAVSVELGDGDDSADLDLGPVRDPDEEGIRFGVVVAGGSGGDRIVARGRSWYRVELDGGDGDDSLRGPALACADCGGIASDSTELPHGLKGGNGNDVVVAGASATVIDEGERTNGSDTIRGGRGHDTLTYANRGRRLEVDLDGRRDDGERGERDLIGRSVETVVGGRGDDLLIGDARDNALEGGPGRDVLLGGAGNDGLAGQRSVDNVTSTASDRLYGGRGDDFLLGSAGPNILVPGAGQDRVRGHAGIDQVRSRDRSIDFVECGGGGDLALIDGLDFYAPSCDRIRRTRPAAAIPLGVTLLPPGGSASTIAIVYCPYDGPRVCRGTLRIDSRRGSLGPLGFSIRRGHSRALRFAARPRLSPGERLRTSARSRDRLGRWRVLTYRGQRSP